MKDELMNRPLFLALPVLALLTACDTQDNATTQSETTTVPGDDGAMAAPDGMNSRTTGSDASTTTTVPGETAAPRRAPDANTPEPGGPENTQGDNRIRAPGPTNPPPDGTTPPPT